jgi:hypothetical protein
LLLGSYLCIASNGFLLQSTKESSSKFSVSIKISAINGFPPSVSKRVEFEVQCKCQISASNGFLLQSTKESSSKFSVSIKISASKGFHPQPAKESSSKFSVSLKISASNGVPPSVSKRVELKVQCKSQ